MNIKNLDQPPAIPTRVLAVLAVFWPALPYQLVQCWQLALVEEQQRGEAGLQAGH